MDAPGALLSFTGNAVTRHRKETSREKPSLVVRRGQGLLDRHQRYSITKPLHFIVKETEA